MGACRVTPPRRDTGFALAGISTQPPARLPVQLVLRALSPLGRGRSMWSCARRTEPAKRCSSITLVRPYRSLTGEPARSGKPRSSSLSWGRPATPSLRPLGRRNSPTGWARTLDASLFLVAHRRSSSPDNLRSGVTKAHRYEPDINPNRSTAARCGRRCFFNDRRVWTASCRTAC